MKTTNNLSNIKKGDTVYVVGFGRLYEDTVISAGSKFITVKTGKMKFDRNTGYGDIGSVRVYESKLVYDNIIEEHRKLLAFKHGPLANDDIVLEIMEYYENKDKQALHNLKESIVKELAEHVPITDVTVINGELAYSFLGFAKSGHGTLFEKDGALYLETRYNQIDKITNTEDVVRIAYDWDNAYKDEWGMNGNWEPFYLKYELI